MNDAVASARAAANLKAYHGPISANANANCFIAAYAEAKGVMADVGAEAASFSGPTAEAGVKRFVSLMYDIGVFGS